jgi:predicted TIM-barrel fold metal-dependent hydrolase
MTRWGNLTKTRERGKFFPGCVCCEPAPFAAAGPDVSRRSFLTGSAAALGMGAAAAPTIFQAPAQAQGQPRRIDVHHHIIPPKQVEVLTKHGSRPTKWSVQASLEDMDKGGVAKSITSIQNPGVWFGQVNEESRKLARECNEYATRLAQDHKGRFGTFAAIPLPDTEGSLKEIEYAYDTLKVDGIALWTTYTPGKYLGDESFVPVFEELNRRKAVVYTHPTVPDCCGRVVAEIPPSAIEYATDTTRTVGSLIFGKAGIAFKFPDIKWIWSHSGGTIPFLTSRFERLAFERKMQQKPMPILEKYFYEIAQGNTPGQLAALMKMVNISQVMFGSDFPYRDAKEAVDGQLAYGFTDAEKRAIDYENAQRIMPQLKA